MATPGVLKTQENLDKAFAAFQRQHPEIAEAMQVMNVSYQEYLRALAALQEETSTSGNASSACS